MKPPTTLALLAVLGAILVASATPVAVGILSVAGQDNLDAGFAILLFVGLGLYWALGSIIVLRGDGHPIGWLFAVSAAMMGAVFGCWGASALAPIASSDGIRSWILLIGSLLFPPAMFLLLPAVTLTFPTGRLPGPRWRLPVAIVLAGIAVQSIVTLLRPGVIDGGVVNPVGAWLPPLPAWLVDAMMAASVIGGLSIPLGLVLGVIAVVSRFRRSSGEERAQLKWFLAATTPAAILIPLSLSEAATWIPGIDVISVAPMPLAAVAVAIAILRYRLYDIDRIISRTISYALVTAILGAVFVVGVLALQGLLAPFTKEQTLAVAASTLAVFALFQPMRRRVQQVVDRRFDRARYDAARTIDEFGGRLRDEVDLDRLTAELVGTATQAMRPIRAELWLATRSVR